MLENLEYYHNIILFGYSFFFVTQSNDVVEKSHSSNIFIVANGSLVYIPDVDSSHTWYRYNI